MPFYYSYDAKSLYDVLQQNLTANKLNTMYHAEELHCTMLYNKNDYDDKYNKFGAPDTLVKIIGIEKWQTPNGAVLVATLDNTLLRTYHDHIKNTFGIEHAHNFTPHITLQKTPTINELLDSKEVEFLIGEKVVLNNFRCINAQKNHLKKNKP